MISIYDHDLPIVHKIAVDITNGSKIRIQGSIPRDAHRFWIDLQCSVDVAIHISPRFDEMEIVRNTFTAGAWGKEERRGGMPLCRGDPFDMLIECDDVSFMGCGNFLEQSCTCSPEQHCSYILMKRNLFIIPLLGCGLLSHGEGLSVNHYACSMRFGDFRLKSPDFLEVSINGQHFCKYIHRIPYDRITHLVVFGDVKIIKCNIDAPSHDLVSFIMCVASLFLKG